jgi:hypothetical protein
LDHRLISAAPVCTIVREIGSVTEISCTPFSRLTVEKPVRDCHNVGPGHINIWTWVRASARSRKSAVSSPASLTRIVADRPAGGRPAKTVAQHAAQPVDGKASA